MKALLQSLVLGRARTDLATFVTTCLRDEVTGQPVKLAPHHKALIRLWTSCKRSMALAPSEFGKSQLAAAFIAWRLGRDPSLRVLLVSGTREQAQRQLRAVAIIMNHPAYQRIFPGRTLERVTADELSVGGRPATMKDVNVTAVSYELSSAQGLRVNLAVLDDVVSREACRTQSARDAAWQNLTGIVLSRVGATGEVHGVNTSEHSDDLCHRLGRLPGWRFERFPALDEDSNPTWPERWPADRIEARRHELGPANFRRAMLCQPIDAASQVFSEEIVLQAVRLGEVRLGHSSVGGQAIVTLDPAWSTSARADESGLLLTVIDDARIRWVNRALGLRVNSDSLVSHAVHLAQAAGGATIYVESNSGGQLIAEQIQKVYPRTRMLHTSAATKSARVEWLMAELEAGRWAFRNLPGERDRELDKLVDELLTFSFESHMGDRLSALLLAVEAARQFEGRRKVRFFHFEHRPGGPAIY